MEGRLKDVIVTGGENVSPQAVEAVLCAHPSVADAAVRGLPDPEWGEAVTAFVVERAPVSDYELLGFCRERLAGLPGAQEGDPRRRPAAHRGRKAAARTGSARDNRAVAETDVEVVRQFLAAMPEDWVAAHADDPRPTRMAAEMLPLTHPEFELHAPSEMIELGAPPVGGRPWFELFGEWLETFATYTERYTDFIDAGPGVVLIYATIGGTTATDGVAITREAGAVYRLEGRPDQEHRALLRPRRGQGGRRPRSRVPPR